MRLLPTRFPTQLTLLCLVIFLTRLPFLSPGYGNDGDAWRVADAALQMAETGSYTASRLPGYPLYEIVAASIVRFGSFVLNAFSALMGVIAVLFFALTLRQLKCRDTFPATIAFALTPVIYINNVSSMDFMLGLAFGMIALYFTLRGRLLWAGVMLGMAIGSRMTWGAMLLPLLILSLPESGRPDKKQSAFVLITLGVGTLWFIPVWLQYGWGSFWFADMYPPLVYVFYQSTAGFWGSIGIVVLSLLTILRLFRGPTPDWSSLLIDLSTTKGRRLLIASILGIALYLIAFIRLPHDASYLIPALPFVLILLALWFSRRQFLVLCTALSLSPFLLALDNHGVYLPGPIFFDHSERTSQIAYVEAVLDVAEEMNESSLIVAGNWLYKIIGTGRERKWSRSVEFVYLLDSAEAHGYLARGWTIYFLPKQELYNADVYGFSLPELGAIPFPSDSSSN